MKNCKWFMGLLLCLICSVAYAQEADSIPDSIRIQLLYKQLEEARLNEANVRMEMENLRLETIVSDSLRRLRLRKRIDSLRSVTKGVSVVIEGDTLFNFYTNRGGYTPQVRAEMAISTITDLGKRFDLKPDSLYVENSEIVSDIMYENLVIASFTDHDALWENCSRQELANRVRGTVVLQLKIMNEQYGLWQFVLRIVYFLLVVLGQFLLFKLTSWLFRRLKVRTEKLKDTRLKPFYIQNYELLDTQKQVNLLCVLLNISRYVVIFLQLLFSVPLLFVIFPQTKDLAYQIFSYIWAPIQEIALAVVNYIPNFFTILVIYYAVRYLIRGIGYLAKEVEGQRLKINGFYPDWAMPTFHIVRFLLYAFMIAMIFPHLPRAESDTFKGVSVFVGLIVSLGSTTVIGNIIAGLVITYMRPFKIGDRIKLNETTGNVIEKTAFVTRIRTPKNELVTIPNSFIMSSHTVNYSSSARKYGLIIHSEVTIGYDVPWRKVHQLLTDAALATPGVMADPEPFVLETALSDWYPVYQINAYISEADKMAAIYSALHQNIQDYFHKADVEIMSPHYMAMREGNDSTIPKENT